MEFNESKTKRNLLAAFAGESQARNKYTYFAEQARKENYFYIAKMFEESAENERQHAQDHFQLLKGIGDTKANLKDAIEGEFHETTNMYPDFAKVAEEEGFTDAARLFNQIAKIEKHHELRYRTLLKMVEEGMVYKRDKPIRWKCSKCGYVFEGIEPPKKCPSCQHPREYYEPEAMCFE